MARILVIEDDPGTQLLLQSRLQDLGHVVVIAPTGAMGVMEARAGGFDLFLVDVMLGAGIDGYEVCRRIKAMPHVHAVPVVLVSGQVKGRDELHRGYESGCDSFLIKGDNTLLEDVVRAMLRTKALQDDLHLQNRLLDEHNRRLLEERRRGADLEVALRASEGGAKGGPRGDSAVLDALMVVDSEGLVRLVDRGGRELFGRDVEGRNLGSLAVGSGLEAFVRDARTEPRHGFRFDLRPTSARDTLRLTASVIPLVPRPGHPDPGLRIVLIQERSASVADRRDRELAPLIEAARSVFHPGNMVGEADSTVDLRARLAELAKESDPVLLVGEEGTGRHRAARALHHGSNRRGPFLTVDCGAMAPESLERELFGHSAGAFDGADKAAPGLLERASHGSLLLADIGLMPSALQRRLVEAVTTGRTTRVGDATQRRLSCRLIAHDAGDLTSRVEAGTFDPELRKLFANHVLRLAPLRERREDIVPLAEHFAQRYGVHLGRPRFSDEALWVIESFDWLGNVRELESMVERACRAATEPVVDVDQLPRKLRDLHASLTRNDEMAPQRPRTDRPTGTHVLTPVSPMPAPRTQYGVEAAAVEEEPISLESFERKALLRALEHTGGDKLAAARLLKIGKSTLYRKLKRYDIK
ncbi:sigma 54-interacting transcriptional regulator [Engelhardtia mirabilis]|uniref:Psp operon transcriptional activator n=1 Tax=Engelhardtia mirabilis TaxID=2528011 RepID=A0A518BRW2_9BACT|nr:Psp operon transcriptional activator [Planctomycetes bacterium Pla133]QDV04034.1 Psp operon transcriptional activator [Planctomycetes bacterium Pla86]